MTDQELAGIEQKVAIIPAPPFSDAWELKMMAFKLLAEIKRLQAELAAR